MNDTKPIITVTNKESTASTLPIFDSTNKTVTLPKFCAKNFDEIKENVIAVLDCYKEAYNEVDGSNMLLTVYSNKNEDGSHTVFLGAMPEDNLQKVRFFGDVAIKSLSINRELINPSIKVIIYEQSYGLPKVGDYAVGNDKNVYQITDIEGTTIHRGKAKRPNYVYGEAKLIDWTEANQNILFDVDVITDKD